MNCPHCHSQQTTRLNRTTDLGYQMYRCCECQRYFNERTETPFNFLEAPTDIVFQVLLYRFRYKLSLRDVAFMRALNAVHTQEPHVITVDKNAAYPKAIDELKAKKELPKTVKLRQKKYLNNIVE